jgi:DNA-binding NarL/FixJ family response regulator
MDEKLQAQELPAPLLDVVLIEDHGSTRQEMSSLLDGEPDITVVGQSASAEEGLPEIQNLSPSVVVMDVALPGMNGLAATRRICSEWPNCRVLILSNHIGPDLVRLALSAGARGFVRKENAYEELIPAVRALGQDMHYWGAGIEDE